MAPEGWAAGAAHGEEATAGTWDGLGAAPWVKGGAGGTWGAGAGCGDGRAGLTAGGIMAWAWVASAPRKETGLWTPPWEPA